MSKQIELENSDLKQQISFIGRIEESETMFFIIKKSEKTTFYFWQNSVAVVGYLIYEKGNSKYILNLLNLLNGNDNESSKFATRKWYVINDQNNTEYGERNENDSSIKFETKVIKSSVCDYSDAHILVTGDMKVTAIDADTNVSFKNCAPFTRFVIHLNDEDVDTAENLDIIMNMYNLLEYSDN